RSQDVARGLRGAITPLDRRVGWSDALPRRTGRRRVPPLLPGPPDSRARDRASGSRRLAVARGSGDRSLKLVPLWILAPLAILTLWVSAAAGDARFETLVQEARSAAARDDHATAIEKYREAIAIVPAARDSLAVPLAAQLTWA